MLVIMEDRDITTLFQFILYIEALGPLYILKVYSSEGRCNRRDDIYEFIGVLFCNLDIKDIYVGKTLEEHPLALHYRFAGKGSSVTQA